MAREPNIPIFLWVATAALAHIMWGGGAEQAVRVVESKTSLNRFARSVQVYVKRANSPIEIALWDESEDEPQAEPEPSDQGQAEDDPEEQEEDPEENAVDEESDTDQKPKPEDEPPEEKEKPKPVAQAEEKKEQEQKRVPVPVPALDLDRRVAVEQHVEDKEQDENPDAEFIGEHNNRVAQQTQARITSTDQNEKETSLDSDHAGPTDDPGSSHIEELAQSRDTPGDPEESPSESDKEGLDKAESARAKVPTDPSKAVYGESAPRPVENAQDKTPRPGSKGQKARQAQVAQEASPKLLESETGSGGLVTPEREQLEAQTARKARKRQARVKRKPHNTSPLAGRGTLQKTPGGLNPNLTPLAALDAIGEEQLQRERLADGERRRSKHRGSWRAIGLERWKSAIENYVAKVQPGNQTALNTARKPFARYLNHIHNRLHPEFAHSFLGSLDSLPSDHPMNRQDIRTHLEIVLSAEDGRVVQMGVTRASGSTAFDVGALEAVQDASPFGTPPREIVSPDGRVYLHWEFHRNPIYACSTYFARPFILRVAPKPAPAPEPSPPPKSTPEDGKHGRLVIPSDKAPRQDG